MKKQKFEEKLFYVSPEEQYKNMERNDVPAQYIRSQNPLYQNNPFIEALPLPRGIDECIRDYSVDIPGFNRATIQTLSNGELLRQVKNIREFRVPLPYIPLLENNIYNAICNGYKNKYQVMDEDLENVEGSKALLWNEPITDACIGFSLVGHSGCGKTSSLKLALSHIPQVIRHKTLRSNFVQIPYLFVTCSAHSNMKDLMCAVGRSLDIALGYTDKRYETKITKFRTIGECSQEIQSMIEAFGIGIIIFDEIQEMNFSHLNKNSFHPMLTISERCKIAFGYVGTEAAIEKLTEDEYISRRAGTPIHADSYAENRHAFQRIFNTMQNYQWLKSPCFFDPTIVDGIFKDKFVEKMYQYSGGIINRAVTLFIYLQMEAIQKNCLIDEELLNTVIDRDFEDLKILQRRKKSRKSEIEIAEIFQNANIAIDASSDEQAQNEFENYLEQNTVAPGMNNKKALFEKVCDNINICGLDYSKEQILKACESIYKIKKNQKLTDREFTPLVTAKLGKSPKKKSAKPKIESSHIESNLHLAINAGKELF